MGSCLVLAYVAIYVYIDRIVINQKKKRESQRKRELEREPKRERERE